MRSRKPFTIEFTEGEWKTRILVPNTATKFDPEKHFRELEESDFLRDALNGVPYVTFSTDSTEEMNNLMQNGYDDKRGVIWTPFFAYWKDQEGRAFLVPSTSGIRDLRDVGITTSMKSPGDYMKVAKYANRLFAALPKETAVVDLESGKVDFTGGAIWGKEVSWNEHDQTAIVTLDIEGSDLTDDDKEISIRYVDLKGLATPEHKSLVDGCLVVSEKAAKRLGLSKNPTLGMAWRGTFGTERGLGKGHILYKNDMDIDVVIYGPKTILKTDKFFFGSMGPLHAGVPHTDMQAYVNFGFHRPGLGVDIAKAFMREVMEASKNEPALRQLLLKHSKQDDKQINLDTEGWILRRAEAYGISFLRFPGLYRRVVRYLMKKVFATDANARIPLESTSYSVAKYGYVLTDINAIDAEGGVIPENAIPEGTIVFPDLAPGTKVVCYRQPSENSNAWVPLTVTYKPEYKRFAGQGICLLGRGADKVLGRLGGGDMDDSFVIVHDPKWVEAFHTLRTYPETKKISAESTEEEQQQFDATVDELTRFEDELTEDVRNGQSHYTNRHVAWQIELAKHMRAGIGPVVNFGMMDLLLSDPDHTASMLADLNNAPEEAKWLDDYRNWEYPDDDMLSGTSPNGYHARKYMTNLELVIDGNVKDRTLLAKLGDVSGTIKKFHSECRVYPASMSPWRIPDSKIEAGGYKTARSLTCRSLEMIRLLRERLEEIFIEREWDIVTPATNDLDSLFPFEREIKARVRGIYRKDRDTKEWVRMDPDNRTILDIWGQEWREALSIPNNPEVKSGAAYKRIIDLIAQEVEGEDDDMMKRIAVQVYREVYKKYGTDPQLDELTGKMRNFKDGLLWSPVFGNHFINACREARVSGLYKAATLRPEYIGRLMGKSVVVQIRDKNVFIQDSNDEFTVLVGWMEGQSWNGKFRMDSGLVEFRKSQPFLQPDDERMVTPRPLVRVFPSTKVEEKPAAEPKVPGAFGKLLDKALGALGMKSEDKK